MSTETRQKPSVTIVYSGEGKGKTSAGIGLVCRSLGYGQRVAFIQFIKAWHVNEHNFFDHIATLYGDKLLVHKGGRGFYHAGSLSARGVSDDEHQTSAADTYAKAYSCVTRGSYDLVVCDEINNAVHDGLLSVTQLDSLLTDRHPSTSLCLTGRNFPDELIDKIDIMSDMRQIRHHYDDGFIANPGIDY